jgi:carbonic anhydrase/acetyltransferase-like protein (isoleucine patch superfamily)
MSREAPSSPAPPTCCGTSDVLIEHMGERPKVHHAAYVAPTAVVCGDVTIGEDTRVLFGAVITAEGGPVTIGARCVIMENAVIRGAPKHPCRVGDHVLIGPRAYLTGCTVEDECFLATGATVFNGAALGTGAEVKINGLLHVNSVLPAEASVPIGWVAVGDPAQMFPPEANEEIWAIQRTLDFLRTVFGVSREDFRMPEIMERYTRSLGRHRDDRVLPES